MFLLTCKRRSTLCCIPRKLNYCKILDCSWNTGEEGGPVEFIFLVQCLLQKVRVKTKRCKAKTENTEDMRIHGAPAWDKGHNHGIQLFYCQRLVISAIKIKYGGNAANKYLLQFRPLTTCPRYWSPAFS